MSIITVDLGSRSYPIHVAAGALADAGSIIVDRVRPTAAALLTHPSVGRFYAEPILRSLERAGVRTALLEIPSGERYKTLRTVADLYERLVDAQIDRKGVVINLGGGVLGDMGGFAAATYLRGLSVVQIPTTLLAQVDAAIGGKTGVDLARGKNLVGAFHQPSAVIVDPATLATLPIRELRSGLAEVVKYGIISGDEMLSLLARDLGRMLRRDVDALMPAIERSCAIKACIVSEDETEQGRRAVLNFGHTVGHALESVTGYRRYKHGEAVAIGMVSACLIGEEIGVTPPCVTRQLLDLLVAAHLPAAFPSEVNPDSVLAAMARDKKAVAGQIRFVLARAAGDVYVADGVPAGAVSGALERQRNLR